MSWSLKRPNVSFRVRPVRQWDARPKDMSKPIAGLSPLARALWRDKREKETRKVAPALELRR